MKPIRFVCQKRLSQDPQTIAGKILDTDRWSEFTGYGFLPGIRSAEFVDKTPEICGSRIRVENRDGSSHTEEILVWEPSTEVVLRLCNFSAPLAKLADQFVETWTFQRVEHETVVQRSFALHPKTIWAKPVLWFISFFLKKAVDRHMDQIQKEE